MAHWTTTLGDTLGRKQAFTPSGDMAAGDPAAQQAAAGGGGAPPVDPAAAAGGGMPPGGGMPAGVTDPAAQDPSMGGMVADPAMAQQPGMQPGMPQQPGMAGAPTPKIDEGLTALQILRMLTAVIEHVRGGGEGGGEGGGGPEQGGEEAAAGGQPAGVNAGMGDDMELQSRVQMAIDQVQQGMRGLVQPSGEAGKPKVDMKVALLYIQKLSAALVDMCGIPIPASHMVTTPEDVMQAGGQGQQPPAGGAPAGEGVAQPVQPVQPVQPMGAKAGSDNPYGLVPMPRRSSLGARVGQLLRS